MTKIANQRKSRWITYELGDAIQHGNFPYPMLPHYLISRLPKKRWPLAAVALNLASDVSIGLALYALFRWPVLPTLELAGGDPTLQRALALAVGAVFVSTPLLVPLTARVRATNGRAPSLPLATAVFAGIAWIEAGGGGLAWGGSAFALFCLALTSFFGLQAVVFSAPLIALFTGSFVPLILVAGVGVLGWLVPPLGIRDLLVFKVNHWVWYAGNRMRLENVAKRNLIANTLRLPALFFRDGAEARKLLFQQSPVWIAAYSLPVLWLVGFAAFDADFRESVASAPLMAVSGACVLAAAILFVATSIDPLTIFGQAERYFEYATPAMALLAGAWAAQHGAEGVLAVAALVLPNVSVLLLIHLLSETANLRRLTRGQGRDQPEKDLARHLAQIEGELRVATVPIKLPALLSYYTKPKLKGRLRYYYRFIQHPERPLDAFDYFTQDTEELDVFRGSVDALAERYRLGWIIADRSFVENRKASSEFVASLAKRSPCYENERYALYALDGADASEEPR
ncbi:MAG: hypothetical protein QNK05_00075 [Myxococcota bacterium]|nr:hypothetical protein [Myxococcota bacterium]